MKHTRPLLSSEGNVKEMLKGNVKEMLSSPEISSLFSLSLYIRKTLGNTKSPENAMSLFSTGGYTFFWGAWNTPIFHGLVVSLHMGVLV